MESKTIYTKLTYNIERKISQFKDGKISKEALNEQMLINWSSMCRFLKKRETQKTQLKATPNQEHVDLNDTILDVFVPFSRLSATLQRKIESMNLPETIEEEKEFEKDLDFDVNEFGRNSEGENTLFDKKEQFDDFTNGTAAYAANKKNDFTNLLDGVDDFDAKQPESLAKDNNQFLWDDNQSICMSLFNHPIEGMGNTRQIDPFSMPVTNQSFKANSNANANANNNSKLITTNTFESDSRFSAMTGSKADKSAIDEEKKKEIATAINEFETLWKDKKTIIETVNEMSIDYLRSMYSIYTKMKNSLNGKGIPDASSEICESNSWNFINKFKAFVLEIGISDKKFYEQCIREIIYNKNMFEFSEFWECFKKLLNLKFDQTFLKYKFLFHITRRKNEDYFEEEDWAHFFNLLLNCKKIYDMDIYEEIKAKFVWKYKKIFPNEDRLYTRKLSLVWEQFFDLK